MDKSLRLCRILRAIKMFGLSSCKWTVFRHNVRLLAKLWNLSPWEIVSVIICGETDRGLSFFFLTKVPDGLYPHGVVDLSFYTLFFFYFLFIIVYLLHIQKVRNHKKFSSNFVLLGQSHLEWMPPFFIGTVHSTKSGIPFSDMCIM